MNELTLCGPKGQLRCLPCLRLGSRRITRCLYFTFHTGELRLLMLFAFMAVGLSPTQLLSHFLKVATKRCLEWGGLNDKFAVLPRAHAAAWMRLLEAYYDEVRGTRAGAS